MVNKAWKIIPRPVLETVLHNHAQRHRVPQPLIVHGPRGVGKTTLVLEREPLSLPFSLPSYSLYSFSIWFSCILLFRSSSWVERRPSHHWLRGLGSISQRPPPRSQLLISLDVMVQLPTTQFDKSPDSARAMSRIHGWEGCPTRHH